MLLTPLSEAVEAFVCSTHAIPDADLARSWGWQSYNREGIRYAFFRTYEELRELAVKLMCERVSQGNPRTAAQHILAQYTAAYWDLQAALLSAREDQLDQAPVEGEWPVRQILGHIGMVDQAFYITIQYALNQHRGGIHEPARVSREAWVELGGIDPTTFQTLVDGPFADFKTYYAGIYARILHEFSAIRADELDLLSRSWEAEPMSLRFRLHRLDAHVRQHTIQLDKTTQALNGQPNEAKRLGRLIYAALAEVNGALIGAWDLAENIQVELASTIRSRTEEILAIVA